MHKENENQNILVFSIIIDENNLTWSRPRL